MEQAHPAQQLQTLGREELVPGETALLNIVRGNNSKKDPEKVCVFCNKTFISRENRLKHTDKCHRGTTHHTIGKVRKEYVCVLCGKNYCNQRTLVSHTKTCQGNMCHIAPFDISYPEPEGGKIEVCSNTTQHSPGPTHNGDTSAQTSEYSVSDMGAAPEGSQGSAAIMPETQTPEHGKLTLESDTTGS